MKSFNRIILTLLLVTSLNASANVVEIVDAKASKAKDGWKVDVTLNHADVDMDHYADQWRVLTKEGKVLGVRELTHPHEDQPFTRSLKGIQIPNSIKLVYVEAHDKVHGWAKKKFELKLK